MKEKLTLKELKVRSFSTSTLHTNRLYGGIDSPLTYGPGCKTVACDEPPHGG